MNYRETFSPRLYGVKRTLIGFIGVLITYAPFFVLFSEGDYGFGITLDYLYRNRESGGVIIGVVFSLVYIGFGTVITCIVLYQGILSFRSKNNWIIEINENTFSRQTPHKFVGIDFLVPLKDINKIIKNGDSADEETWFMCRINGEVINISDDSPFNTERIVQKLLSANPEIEYLVNRNVNK